MKPRKHKSRKSHIQPIPLHTEIFVSPDGRSMTEITEERQVAPNHIHYSIHESSVYRNPPFVFTKKNKRTRKHQRKPRNKK